MLKPQHRSIGEEEVVCRQPLVCISQMVCHHIPLFPLPSDTETGVAHRASSFRNMTGRRGKVKEEGKEHACGGLMVGNWVSYLKKCGRLLKRLGEFLRSERRKKKRENKEHSEEWIQLNEYRGTSAHVAFVCSVLTQAIGIIAFAQHSRVTIPAFPG